MCIICVGSVMIFEWHLNHGFDVMSLTLLEALAATSDNRKTGLSFCTNHVVSNVEIPSPAIPFRSTADRSDLRPIYSRATNETVAIT